MTLVPELTVCEHERVTLNSLRYFFTIFSNLLVFALKAVASYNEMALITLVVGVVCSLFFLFFTPEPILLSKEEDDAFNHKENLLENERIQSDDVDSESEDESLNINDQDIISIPTLQTNVDSSLNLNPSSQLPSIVRVPPREEWKEWFFVKDFYLVALVYMNIR
jgi:Na+/melibiose symporter-like transporter